MTSARKRKRLIYARVAHNNAWNWSFDRFVRAVVAAHNKMAKVLEETYAKAREKHDHAG